MKRFYAFLGLFAVCAGTPGDGCAAGWPKLTAKSSAQCMQALQVARATFDSNTFYLYAPPVIPANFSSLLALKPNGEEISGGDALEADRSVFDKLPRGDDPNAPRSLYWQKKPSQGYRLVVAEASAGWRGDTYTLFYIDERIQPKTFLAGIGGSTMQGAIMKDSWRPPLVFQDKASRQLWFVDVGQPYEIQPDWKVYVAESTGMQHPCDVQFHPRGKQGLDLLPQPVRGLEQLLNKTMGNGKEDGTLQPGASLRQYVEHAWANAALRPWVSGRPYNSRQEVNAALERWSQGSAANRKVYQAIQSQYPVAEKALADYYQQNFGRSAVEAKLLAAYLLDEAFRAHYVFHREDSSGGSGSGLHPKNPWSTP